MSSAFKDIRRTESDEEPIPAEQQTKGCYM